MNKSPCLTLGAWSCRDLQGTCTHMACTHRLGCFHTRCECQGASTNRHNKLQCLDWTRLVTASWPFGTYWNNVLTMVSPSTRPVYLHASKAAGVTEQNLNGAELKSRETFFDRCTTLLYCMKQSGFVRCCAVPAVPVVQLMQAGQRLIIVRLVVMCLSVVRGCIWGQ